MLRLKTGHKKCHSVFPEENSTSEYFLIGTTFALYIDIRKRELKMEKMIFYVSDCCGVESNVDHEICSRCGEHCEIITEEYEIEKISG
jgi:hypothetical protein